MAVGDLYRCTIQYLLHGQQVMNVIHYRSDTAMAGNGQAALATKVDAFMPTVLAELSQEILYQRVVVQKFFPFPPLPPTVNSTNAGLGDIVQDSLPVHVCATITTRTQFAGPGFRGRVYIAGLPVTYAEDSLITGTALDALQRIAAEYFSSRIDTSWTFTPVLVHRAAMTAENITSAEGREVLRSLRRRQVGRGI